MLSQRTVSKQSAGECHGCSVPGSAQLPGVVIRWADRVRGQGLGDVALILTDLLKVWGFAGSQVLWMLAPFVEGPAVVTIATVLESPEMLDQVRTYLEGHPGESKGDCR